MAIYKLEMQEATRNWEGSLKEIFSLSALEATNLADTLILNLQSPDVRWYIYIV